MKKSAYRRLSLLRLSLLFFLALGSLETAAAFDLKPYRRGDFAQIVGAHAGRPLILHYWSVACPACVAELGQWGKLIDERKDIDIIFINTDDEDDRARAVARLEKSSLLEAVHYGFADSFSEKLYYETDKNWRGELPFTALIAPNRPHVTVTGAVTDPAFIAWLASVKP